MNQAGVTLVELLVSLALSAIALLGAMQFMSASLQSSTVIKNLSNLHDKAQHAMSLFRHSVSRAGYLGCGGRSAEISSLLREDLRLVPELNLFEPYAIYRSDLGSATWTPDLASLPIRVGGTTFNSIDGRRGIDVASLIPGNDLLVVRGLGFAASRIVEPVGVGESVKVDSRRRLGRGAFAAITDCQSLEVFRITSHGSDHGAVVLHRAGGVGAHDNHPDNLLHGKVFEHFEGASPMLFPVHSEFFFIAASGGDESLPALWRKQTGARALELLEGISELEVRELADVHGHAIGLRVGFQVLTGRPDREATLKRRFIRHLAFENL